MAKKIIFTALLVLALASCRAPMSGDIADISFTIDTSKILQQNSSLGSVSRFVSGSALSVKAELLAADGSILATDSKQNTLDKLVSMTLHGSAGQTVKVRIVISDSAGAKLYEGASAWTTLVSGANTISISLRSRRFLFSFDPDGNFVLYTSDKNPTLKSVPSGTINDIDFDNYGNAYVGIGESIYKFDPDISESAFISIAGGVPGMAVDRSANKIYYFYNGDISFTSLATTSSNQSGGFGSPDDIKLFAVDNNVLYGTKNRYEKIESGTEIKKYNITQIVSAQISYTAAYTDKKFVFPAKFMSSQTPPAYYINDMTVQDGFLWVIVSTTNFSSPGDFNKNTPQKGALLKINTETMELAGTYGLTESLRPSKDNTSFFYGPSRFIAFVPGKLIIADEGVRAVTAGEIAPSIDAKQRNRIMTFNIASSTFSKEDVDAEFIAKFNVSGSEAFE